MKNLFKTFIALILLLTILPSCKKDAVDLSNSYVEFITSEAGLWAGENDVRMVANLTPGSITGDKVPITISSEANPNGVTFDAAYYKTTLESGRDVYNIQQIDYTFKVGAFNNEDKRTLKVNPNGDKVTVKIGDNILTESISFIKPFELLIVANITISGNGYITGNINYYNETGLRPTIKLYSASNSTAVYADPNPDLGDNGYYAPNPDLNDYFGYTTYSTTLVYEEENAPGFSNQVFVDFESDVLFVEINGKKYSVPIEGETIYKTIMAQEY